MRIIYRVKPCCVVGLGGFVTGPGGMAAWLMRVPLVIHEQNAIPGLTNSWLARFARKVLSGFPGAFSHQNTDRFSVTGNPVRDTIIKLAQHSSQTVKYGEALKILVVGGSLGATAINELMPHAVSLIPENARPHIWHQTGNQHLHLTQSTYEKWHVNANVVAFIDDMATAYSWADLVVCRSGALTVSELSAAGVASVLIPYPYAVDDHQTANAMFLVRANAAVLMQQREISADGLARLLMHFDKHREQLDQMARAAKAEGKSYATQEVITHCLEVVNEHAA
jgi:UDP-N-acetylglucosamine--N-acetylmuramyl-(pentapeptide) pyrophosphoryl-undecaprenol N-acetylglucosamine transferase